ncbi:hypothetical protein [Gephyromycinifex aptenodytis]|uniref:hypothetical protein n=1 Tax=Gephyromycinifex aptenodytis TaxID=2716227 RepID=UPI001444AE7E|nr:hypothetical protein [Gephyromycinifex aptenodytis]
MRIVNHHAGCCGYLPVKPDGTQWSHVYGLPGGGSVHADTPGEILAELIPGYEHLDQDQARQARIRHALTAAAQAQDQAIVRAGLSEVDPEDAALAAVLRLDKGAPLTLADPQRPDESVPWEGGVALVLVATSYAPHTEVAPPAGNVVWIDPDTEQGYLDSLRASAAFDYWRDALA